MPQKKGNAAACDNKIQISPQSISSGRGSNPNSRPTWRMFIGSPISIKIWRGHRTAFAFGTLRHAPASFEVSKYGAQIVSPPLHSSSLEPMHTPKTAATPKPRSKQPNLAVLILFFGVSLRSLPLTFNPGPSSRSFAAASRCRLSLRSLAAVSFCPRSLRFDPSASRFGLPLRPPASSSHTFLVLPPSQSASCSYLLHLSPTQASRCGLTLPPPTAASRSNLPLRPPAPISHCGLQLLPPAPVPLVSLFGSCGRLLAPVSRSVLPPPSLHPASRSGQPPRLLPPVSRSGRSLLPPAPASRIFLFLQSVSLAPRSGRSRRSAALVPGFDPFSPTPGSGPSPLPQALALPSSFALALGPGSGRLLPFRILGPSLPIRATHKTLPPRSPQCRSTATTTPYKHIPAKQLEIRRAPPAHRTWTPPLRRQSYMLLPPPRPLPQKNTSPPLSAEACFPICHQGYHPAPRHTHLPAQRQTISPIRILSHHLVFEAEVWQIFMLYNTYWMTIPSGHFPHFWTEGGPICSKLCHRTVSGPTVDVVRRDAQ